MFVIKNIIIIIIIIIVYIFLSDGDIITNIIIHL